MEFKDEFELEMGGKTFFVEVEGEMSVEGDVDLNAVIIRDELGQLLGAEDESYGEVLTEVNLRDYEIELHEADFDYYEQNLGSH